MTEAFLFKTPQNSQKNKNIKEMDSLNIEEKKEQEQEGIISFSINSESPIIEEFDFNDDEDNYSDTSNKENIPNSICTPQKLQENNQIMNPKRFPLKDITPFIKKNQKKMKNTTKVILFLNYNN